MILGLTGTLGSGKSTVAKLFEELGGAKVICADAITHQVQAPGGPAYTEIIQAFGPEVLGEDGSLDRGKLAAIVFSSPHKRKILNSIVHPKVRKEELRLLREHSREPLVVLSVPLLLENNMRSLVDRVVVVTIDETSRHERLKRRSGMTDDEIDRRLAAQMPDAQKAAMADFVIDNSGSLEHTREQVKEIIAQVARCEKPAETP